MTPELRKYLCEGLSGALTRGNPGEFDVRMPEEQPHQFFTGVTGPADDGDFLFHLRCPWSVAELLTTGNERLTCFGESS